MAESAKDVLNWFRLDGKVSIVTGASRGLGKTFAEALAGAGSDVVLIGRNIETLKPVAENITQMTGKRTFPIEADIGRLSHIERAVAKVTEEFGRIDVLLNNAGINIRMPAEEYTEEAWDQVIDVNLKGTFFMTQACGKVMIKQKSGKVINILSLTSFIGLPTVIAYSATKGGLAQLTKLLAVEWAEHNIQVNGIAPGYFNTEMTAPVRQDQRNNWVMNRLPAGRWGEPEELTGALVFFASHASDYVTGQILYVDGGMTSGSDWRKGR